MPANPLFLLTLSQAWQITVAAFFAWLLVRIAAKNRPYLAYGIWLIVALKCVTPPLWSHSFTLADQFPSPLTFFNSEPGGK